MAYGDEQILYAMLECLQRQGKSLQQFKGKQAEEVGMCSF